MTYYRPSLKSPCIYTYICIIGSVRVPLGSLTGPSNGYHCIIHSFRNIKKMHPKYTSSTRLKEWMWKIIIKNLQQQPRNIIVWHVKMLFSTLNMVNFSAIPMWIEREEHYLKK